MPIVSVIIPTYNRIHCLRRAIDSVLAQTYDDIELIVVDDGSTDNTAQMVQEHYPSVKRLNQKQQGVSSARNLGIQHATGEWLAFLDSDDEWQPKKLEKQMQCLSDEKNYRICHTNEIWIRNGKRVNPMKKHQKYGGWIFQRCLALCLISPSSVVIHRSLLDEVGLFDETLPACEDYDLWLRITARYPVLYLSEALIIKYGGHDDQLSKKYNAMDRYRIQALINIIKENKLNNEDLSAAKKVLEKKVRIYLNGARKRNKHKEVSYYEKLTSCFNHEL